MNFGVRLPGPFRVGVSSSGRPSVGVTLGPFSASTGIGTRRRPTADDAFYPIELDAAAAEVVALGWRLGAFDGQTALLTKGWQAVQIEAVPAGRSVDRAGRWHDTPAGVTWRPVTSRRGLITAILVIVAVVGLCAAVAN